MSPEIRKDGVLIADVPDETDWHPMLDGTLLWVDVSGIDAENKSQPLVLESPAIGGRRVVYLSLEGKGNTTSRKRKGDQREPMLDVTLKELPIRSSSTRRRWHESHSLGTPRSGYWVEDKRTTYRNPRWVRSHG